MPQSLAAMNRVLLVVMNGAHFPNAAAALRDLRFEGEMRVVSPSDWRPVIAGKCTQFVMLPPAAAPASRRAAALGAALAKHHGWAQAIVWVEPSALSRRVFIRALRKRRPVYSFYDGHLKAYGASGRLGPPGIQHVGGEERELAIRYLSPGMRKPRREAPTMRLGIDGDGVHERWATGIQWYRRYLMAALADPEVGIDLAVTYPVRDIRCPWELPWARNLCPVPPSLRSYAPASPAEACPIESITGPIDLFHMTFFDPPPFSFPKLVCTVHDLMPLVIPETYPQRILDKYAVMVPYWRDHCDHIICVSEHTRKDLETLVGIEPERLSVIYHAKHPHYTRRDAAEVASVKRRYGITGSYFVAVGSVVPHKNFQRLCDAFVLAKERSKIPHKLVIVGRPNWRQSEVFAAIGNSPHLADIIFTGYAAYEDLPALYSGAVAYCHPSIYEGYGLPVQEAMCCGCPVLLSNTTSLPEVAGDAGLYWDPMNTEDMTGVLERFSKDEALREDMRARAVRHAETYPSWLEVAQTHRRLYEKVIAAR